MARIASIEFTLARVPLDEMMSFATRSITERHYVLVRVVADDGSSGIGFCYAGHRAGALSLLAVPELLGPVLLGQNPELVEGLWDQLYRESLLHGRTGSVMRALSALDVALWDRNARAADLPLWRHLGAQHSDPAPAYASGGYYRERKTPEDLGKEMKSYVAAGFRAVKMKIGRLDPAGDAERVAAAREAIGPDVHLMLDANNAWSDVDEAMRALDAFVPYRPFWIEEPFSPDDVESHAQLAKRTNIPVATGEIEAGRWRHRELLAQGAAAILQTDAAVCGGITEWLRIAAMAEGFDVTISPHWFHDLHVHLVAATRNARYVEFFPDASVLNFRRLVGRQLEARDGELVLPTEPGLGFDFDEAAVEEFADQGWAEIT
jgi:L-alanine-DL-glutamate epimerase-like enolase superfamily enzyme